VWKKEEGGRNNEDKPLGKKPVLFITCRWRKGVGQEAATLIPQRKNAETGKRTSKTIITPVTHKKRGGTQTGVICIGT